MYTGLNNDLAELCHEGISDYKIRGSEQQSGLKQPPPVMDSPIFANFLKVIAFRMIQNVETTLSVEYVAKNEHYKLDYLYEKKYPLRC